MGKVELKTSGTSNYITVEGVYVSLSLYDPTTIPHGVAVIRSDLVEFLKKVYEAGQSDARREIRNAIGLNSKKTGNF